MKTEIDRIKNDLETMQKALGTAPSMGREWLHWMKRDRWLALWWSVPGIVMIAAALVPHDPVQRYGGLVFDQWVGLLTAVAILIPGVLQMRQCNAKDGRPDGMIRETKRIAGLTSDGFWFGVAVAVEVLVFFIWGRHYGIAFAPFWAGLFLLMGSSFLLAAVASRVWTLLGWGIPFLGYGLCLLMGPVHGGVDGIPLGIMFIAVALSFSFITALQIRMLEHQDDAH